jgi:hypothetical protein
MTGGLAYVLRTEGSEMVRKDFVDLLDIDADEDRWLRLVLEQHSTFTASPVANRLLASVGRLPLLRVQPVHFQGTIEAAWQAVLASLRPEVSAIAPVPSSEALQSAIYA